MQRVQRRRSDAVGIQGIIHSHLFAGSSGFDDAEHRRILVAGRRDKSPDDWTRDGAPIYHLSEREAQRADAVMARLAQDRMETHNIALNTGRTVVLNFLSNAGGYTGINYFAVGTGLVSVASTDTTLVTEVFRKAITTVSISGQTVTFTTTFATTEGNYSYTEAGLFGNGATGTVGSGTLFTHASYVYTKTSSVILTNSYAMSLT